MSESMETEIISINSEFTCNECTLGLDKCDTECPK